MTVLNFRTLHADEIECRVGTNNDRGVSILLYKNARVDMNLLDEVVGAQNWKRCHEVINDNLFCTVSVRFEDGEWVSKQDVGTESYTEKEKGQASDAFKRACFNWGIGRELYTAPFIWINLNSGEWRMGSGGKKVPNVKFHVSRIEYDDNRRISFLEIVDGSGVVRFTYGADKAAGNMMEEAIKLLDDCKTREDVIAVYNKFGELKNNNLFIQACTERTQKIGSAA